MSEAVAVAARVMKAHKCLGFGGILPAQLRPWF